MRKRKMIIAAGMIAVSMISFGSIALANTGGSSAALVDQDYTLEEMLTYAMEDEYNALAEYEAIIGEFGSQLPYSNLIKAEEKHISRLKELFATYELTIPVQATSFTGSLPATLEESYQLGIQAEQNNIAMYEGFLKEELDADVRTVFEALKNASQKHQKAFENAIAGNTANCPTENGKAGIGRRNGAGNGICDGTENGSGLVNGSCNGTGSGNASGKGQGFGSRMGGRRSGGNSQR